MRTSKTTYVAEHPDALAVYCSDGRFTDSVEELLAHLGHPRHDTLTIPGGPCLLELTSSSLGGAETVRSACSFLIEGHGIKHVALMCHAGCGYYRARYPHESPESMLRRQLADLRGAGRWVKSMHPGVKVSLFRAVPDGAQVLFEDVPPNA